MRLPPNPASTSGEPPRFTGATFAGRYTIERYLGEGATSIVYLARDEREGTLVAIKTLRSELAQSISSDRFLREISTTASLSHPAILQVLDSGNHLGTLYCVLPYMKGGTLRGRIEKQKQLPIVDAVAIGATLADALDHAHARNLMHRDVKPENILFDGERVALADFGIAKAIERAAGETTTITGVVRGTPAYMSPEQAGGDHGYDGRSDIYSLGCVIYEMIAGVQAFVGPTPQSVVAQRLIHAPRPLTVYRPMTPPALQQVIERALATAPADRYQRASDFAAALRASATAAPARRPRAHYVAPIAAAILVLAGAALVVVAPKRRSQLEAREALVRGSLHAERFRTKDQMLAAIAEYRKATQLDPELAIAYARLSEAYSYLYNDADRADSVRRAAKHALDNALRLAPASPDTRLALGFYKYFIDGQRDSALVYLEAARSLDRDNATLIGATATMLRASARWEPALALSRRALELEPESPRWAVEVANTEAWMKRYEDADRDFQRAIRLRPDNLTPYVQRLWLQMLWKGDTAAVHAVLAEAERHIPRIDIIKAFLIRYRPSLAMLDRTWQDELERRSRAELGVPAGAYHLAKMELYRRRGQERRARAHADSAVIAYESGQSGPRDEYVHSELALAYAGQRRHADARREAQAALDLAVARNDATALAFRSADVIRVYLALGDYDRAVAQLRAENRNATLFSRQVLLNHPDFGPLRGRADFQALVREFP